MNKYHNPILFSDYSDPDAIRVGDDYYMTASSFTYFPGLPILHSKDLINWTLINYAIKKLPFAKYDLPCHGEGVWAPSIRYHKGRYYIYFATPDEGIFMVSTEDPKKEWDEAVLVKESCGWIDPCPFWDDDGNAYLIRGVAKSRIGYKSKLFLHKMSADGKRLLDEGVLVFDGRINHPTIEGPKMYKKDGYYYIFAPAGGVQQGWQMEARSKNIYGPYEHKVVLHQGTTDINGPHQGALVDTVRGEEYFLHFRDMEGYGRVTYLEPAKWKDGWCEIGVDIDNDGIGEPVAQYPSPFNTEQKKVNVSEDFKLNRLPLRWQWQAHENTDNFTLTEKGLRLFALYNEKENISYFPNLVTALMTQKEFVSKIKISLSLQDGDSFGFLVSGGSYAGLKISKDSTCLYGSLISYELKKDYSGKEKTEAKVPIDKTEIYIKLKLTYPTVISTYISYDDKNYIQIGESAEFKVSRKSWVGGRLGMFCTSSKKNSCGYTDISFIETE